MGGARRWRECNFTRFFCRSIERCNGMTHAVVGNSMAKAGWPDRYIAHPRWRGWIEFKLGSKPLSDIQRSVCHGLHKRGVKVYVGIVRSGQSDFFELRHVNGKTLASIDLLPLIGREQEAGLAFLSMLELADRTETAEQSPSQR